MHYSLSFLYLVCSKFVGQESDQEEEDDEEPSSLSSSLEKNSYCGDDEWLYSLEQMDECVDGEVGKRLNQMMPIPVSFTSQVPLTYFWGRLHLLSFFIPSLMNIISHV